MTDSAAETLEWHREIMACGEFLRDMRKAGWAVAVHNDYRQDGVFMTFWLLTNGVWCAKGEGKSDYEALREVMVQIHRIKELAASHGQLIARYDL
jgi:hypothetical protein